MEAITSAQGICVALRLEMPARQENRDGPMPATPTIGFASLRSDARLSPWTGKGASP